MDTKVSTQTLTDTHKAVFTVTGVLGAFFIGLAFAFALTNLPKMQTQSTIATTNTTVNYLTLGDIVSADLSSDPGNGSTVSEVAFLGLPGGVGNDANFGSFNYSVSSAFQDGQDYTSPYRLKVRINASTHPAMYATINITGSLPDSNQTSMLQIVPEAHAQVTIGVRKVVCIPAKTTVAMLPSDSKEEPKLFGLIQAAQAQVNVNTNLNGNTNTQPAVYTNYYFDSNGNAYWDENITQRVISADCQTMAAKNFSPTTVTDVTLSGQGELPDGLNLTFAKSWNTVFGFYNPVPGYQSGSVTDLIEHAAPLFILGSNNEDTITSFPKFTITAQTSLGSKNLCMPARSVEAHNWFLVFYDTNGKAYNDIALTQPLNCGSSNNSCSNVNCVKFPKHACCASAPVTPPSD